MNAMTCHRARVSFELYLDGALTQEDCDVLENHLFECTACAAAIGDDVLLAESVEATLSAAGGSVPASRPRTWSSTPIRAAAAAILLVFAGVGIGHLTTRGVKQGSPSSTDSPPASDSGSEMAQAEALPPSELSDIQWALGSFTDEELKAAEREGQKSRRERSEWRARRSEAELDLVRPLLEETATPDRVVAQLAKRVRGQSGRPPRDDGNRPPDPFMPVYGAAMLLRRDPHAALGPVVEWLRSTPSTPPARERKAAVKLLALLRLAEAHDVLEAEVAGPARDAALAGLVALRDQRSHDVFAKLMDDASLPPETRIMAAGGMHRLGDPKGLSFLYQTFKEHATASEKDQLLRKRVLFNAGANPTAAARAMLPELIDGVKLNAGERRGMVEWLTLSGMSESDPELVHLVNGGGEHERHSISER